LEQIDVSHELISKYSDTFSLALTTNDIKAAVANGKIASLLGVEGAHQLGNSLSVLRQYYALGVRYVTLTHTCHNAFADSCGFEPGMKPLHGGLR
jgi:membrane dipeptidase